MAGRLMKVGKLNVNAQFGETDQYGCLIGQRATSSTPPGFDGHGAIIVAACACAVQSSQK
jgi:hypothetical protein